VKKAIIILIALIVIIQFVPVDRSNPASDPADEINVASEVKDILKRSCFDCHSNLTVWPWYSYVAPVSWLVADDVEEAREHINFSEWNKLSAEKQGKAKEEIWEQIDEGNMPLPKYVKMHEGTELTGADKEIIRKWCLGDANKIKTDESSHHHKD